MIKDVLNCIRDWKTTDDYPHGQRPVFFELASLKNAIGEYISEQENRCGKAYVDCIREIKPVMSNYNI